MSDKRNKYIIEHASSEEDVAILNTKLIDFLTADQGVDQILVNILAAQILLLCRSNVDASLELVSLSLATALFMVFNQSSSVCLRENVKPFVLKVN